MDKTLYDFLKRSILERVWPIAFRLLLFYYLAWGSGIYFTDLIEKAEANERRNKGIQGLMRGFFDIYLIQNILLNIIKSCSTSISYKLWQVIYC